MTDLQQGTLNLNTKREVRETPAQKESRCALEDLAFPFETISNIADAESWRKELNRPPYHIHKWWAQRLGSVFRAVILGALTPSETDILDLFYSPTSLTGRTIYDPFMGSGTTIGEALKLGANAIGRDINPVAHFLVKNALASHSRNELIDTINSIENDVASTIRGYYTTVLPSGEEAEVLYYFWVKVLTCPTCNHSIDLFPSRIFAKHAYAKKYSKAQAVCPHCDSINEVRYDSTDTFCKECEKEFNPQHGNASGRSLTCASCGNVHVITNLVRHQNEPPDHRLYAKLVLYQDGTKAYLRATEFDKELFERASNELAHRINPYPVVEIKSGYNTDQALGYNYRYWHQMFNDRQLLCLSILGERIRAIPNPSIRELFTCLFSGMLEFNNLFTSYKGEGTGAVRHMFSHHILKPERMPLEANIWGTPKSSGAFTTIFRNRVIRALDYCEDPFELAVCQEGGKSRTKKVYGLSEPLAFNIADSYEAFQKGKRVYLSCGDSSNTDIPAKSIDAVVTDPPFFDNVHYSQLADFFHVWQRHILETQGSGHRDSTRSDAEVQSASESEFTHRLEGVLRESHRVLKNDGVLAFTYHHSRSEGWRSVLTALVQGGFMVTAAHPIKSEMSVATPKQKAREPIDLDIILVCRKREVTDAYTIPSGFWEDVRSTSTKQLERLCATGRRVSRNDVRVVVMAQVLLRLSRVSNVQEALSFLTSAESDLEAAIGCLHIEEIRRSARA